MTNSNYTYLSNQEMLEIIDNIKVYPNKLKKELKEKYPHIYEEILHRTSFLDDQKYYSGKHVPILARIYCLRHNIVEPIKC